MLGKLLKYDLKSVYKVLGIFYFLAISFALIGRLFSIFDDSIIFNFISQFSKGISIGMLVSVLINNFTRVWVRFTKNLYNDESYLTHTLPVSKKTLLMTKFLLAFITIFTGMIISIITIFIAYYSKENFEVIKNMLQIISQTYNSAIFNLLFIILLVYFLQLLLTILIGYVAIIIGHKANDGKMAKSFLFGFMFYVINQVITLVVIFLMALLNPSIMNLFTTNQIANVEVFKSIMYIAIILNILLIVIYYYIGQKQFLKGVNVD